MNNSLHGSRSNFTSLGHLLFILGNAVNCSACSIVCFLCFLLEVLVCTCKPFLWLVYGLFCMFLSSHFIRFSNTLILMKCRNHVTRTLNPSVWPFKYSSWQSPAIILNTFSKTIYLPWCFNYMLYNHDFFNWSTQKRRIYKIALQYERAVYHGWKLCEHATCLRADHGHYYVMYFYLVCLAQLQEI